MKRRYWINDDLAVGVSEIEKVFDSFFPPRTFSYSLRGYDPDKFDLVPRASYYEDKIKRSNEEIEALDRQHESEEKYYQNARKRLVEHKEYLLREKEKKIIEKT
jgi:hypothetical protein